ncbi:MAG: sulfite exporter TauE/SafE family protein [Rhodomicrobium sp.]
MNESLIVFAISGLFFAGVIKGATGIGYSSCALPFLVAALGLKAAIVLLVVPAMASNAAVLFTTGSLERALKRFWPLYLATLPGILAGVTLLMWVDKRIPTHILGVVIAAYAVQAWLRPSFVLQPRIAHAVQVPVGLVNGLLTGFTGSQVMPLMPYMMSLKLDARLFVQAVNIAVVIASVFLGFGLWATGTMAVPELGLSILAVAPALLGVRIGTWARQHIPAAHFRSLVLAVLLFIGLSLLTRA